MMVYTSRRILVFVAVLATGCIISFIVSTKLSPHIHLRTTIQGRRRSLLGLKRDHKSVVAKHDLRKKEYKEPTIIHLGPDSEYSHDVVVDVVSIGSESRIDQLTAQVDTWASHHNVRNYWGFTERHDFDADCSSMSEEALQSYVQTCKSPLGWDERIEEFRMSHFFDPLAIDLDPRAASEWFCAQRRLGRAFGWLATKYHEHKNYQIDIPDVLVLVDDDTSVDIEKLKGYKALTQYDQPFIGSGYLYREGIDGAAFPYPMGGYGTFFNKAALQNMAQPIFCTKKRGQMQSEYTKMVCDNIRKNRVGKRSVFKDGDSVFDMFYKLSALKNFCMHSDWMVGYMVTYYSGGTLSQIGPQGRDRCPSPNTCGCHITFFTCHKQSPQDMENFALTHHVLAYSQHVRASMLPVTASAQQQQSENQSGNKFIIIVIVVFAMSAGMLSCVDF